VIQYQSGLDKQAIRKDVS